MSALKVHSKQLNINQSGSMVAGSPSREQIVLRLQPALLDGTGSVGENVVGVRAD
jgi:hypothetical protein